MKRNKIWLLLDSNKEGGIESHVLQLAIGLQQYKRQVEVIFLTDYGTHPMCDALHQQGIRHRSLDGYINTLYRALKNERPMVLHTHGYKAGILGRLAAWLSHIPSMSTYHAGEFTTGKLAFYDWLDRISAGFADKTFAVSPQIAARLPGNVDVFNNFVNNTNLSTSTGEQIAFVGRVCLEKGPDYFMALATIFPDINFHLYGEGPQLSALKSCALKNLQLHGQQHDMSVVWPKIGLLVIPSRFEGLPMVALEAMARGIPVVAFNVGALNLLIKPQCNGWLIDPGNLDQLSSYINLWNNYNQQQRSFMRLACIKTIKKQFSTTIAIPKLLANYQQISH